MKYFLRIGFTAFVALFLLTACTEYEHELDSRDFFEGKWEVKQVGFINNSNQRTVSNVVPPVGCPLTNFDTFTFSQGGGLQREIFSFANDACSSQIINGQYQRISRNVAMTFTLPGETEATVVDATIVQLTPTTLEFVYTQNNQLRIWVLQRVP
jgi:hypothetical protein